MDERYYWLGFSVFPDGIGPKRFQLLLHYFGSAESAWKASQEELEKSGIGKIVSAKFSIFRKTFSVERYVEILNKKNVQYKTLADKAYPFLLKDIENPPFVLYYKGESSLLNGKTIAIVGTRKITNYGREVTERITESLVRAGYVIVSGLAFGVDAVAHTTTINTKGKTIAVLGCGVDCCSPKENQQLYDRIIETGGIIVSEYPLSAQPTRGSFPSRNRIIAGLSEAVIVTEGAVDSGALYTADNAFTIGRQVFAIPGPITSSLSKGPNSLIAKGALLVTEIDDISQELQGIKETKEPKETKVVIGESKEEQRVIDLLEHEGLLFDELVSKTGFDSAKLGVLLSMMEMKGMIKSLDNGMFGLR